MSSTSASASLRGRAEARVERDARVASVEPPRPATAGTLERVVHELRVHQIELEMQNEELRRVRTELEVSLREHFEIYEVAPIAYCTVDPAGIIQRANLAAASLLGETRLALIGRPFAAYLAKEQQVLHYRNHRKLMESGGPLSWELEMVRAGGERLWAQLTASVGYDSGGALVFRIAMTDLTESSRREMALRESEDRFRALVEWTPVALVVHRHGQVVYASPSAVRLFGAASERDLVGLPLADRLPSDIRLQVLGMARTSSGPGSNGRPLFGRVLRLSGAAVDVEIHGSPMVYDGAPAAYLILLDATERKRLEVENARLCDQLQPTREPRAPPATDQQRQALDDAQQEVLDLVAAALGRAEPDSALFTKLSDLQVAATRARDVALRL
jgi:PAS domain S-box-containing protein